MPDPAEARTLHPPGRGRADPPIRATLAREDHTDIRHTVPPRQSPRYRSGTCVAGEDRASLGIPKAKGPRAPAPPPPPPPRPPDAPTPPKPPRPRPHPAAPPPPPAPPPFTTDPSPPRTSP